MPGVGIGSKGSAVELPFDATLPTLALAALGAFCLGISKTGFPGLAILFVVMAVNIVGDHLTDRINPALRGRGGS